MAINPALQRPTEPQLVRSLPKQQAKPITKPKPSINQQQRQQRPKSDRTNQASQPAAKQQTRFQSIGVFAGRLHVENDQLQFRCPDGTLLQIAGIDPKFSMWLMSRPGELFSPVDRFWLIYPKTHWSGKLTVHLKALILPDRNPPLPIDTCQITGKLLAADRHRMTIGIRRNLSPVAFKELTAKRMIQGSQFEQFTVHAWGQPPADVGSIVQVSCRRDGDRLIVS